MDTEAYDRTRSVQSPLICHAPFESLHFNPIGNAYACDSSYRHPLGRYPDQTIREIWTGAPIRQMRRWVREGDLSHSCQPCQDQLEAGNHYCVRARDYDWLAPVTAAPEAMPRVIEFDLSNVCNLGCVMCHGFSSSWIRQHREMLPALHSPYDERFVEQLEEFLPDLELAAFVGGEPFLSPIYYRIWEMIARVKPHQQIDITTNGTVWNERVRDLLGQLSCAISVSIDSLDQETYESIRINSSFPKVMENLEHFISYCRSTGNPIRMCVCPMRSNWRELPDILRFCNDREVELVFNNVLHPAQHTLRTLGGDDLADVVDHLESRPVDASATVLVAENVQRYRSLLLQIRAWRDDAAGRLEARAAEDVAARVGELRGDGARPAPIRDALMDWVSGLVGIRSPDGRVAVDLPTRLREAREVEGEPAFLEHYFEAIGEIGPVLHSGAGALPRTAREVASVITGHEGRAWFVEQLIRWDPDYVLSSLKTAPQEDLEGWIGRVFALRGDW